MSILNQRDWDIGQLESEMRVGALYQEWLETLLAGRNPLNQIAESSPDDIQGLQTAGPPQIIPPTEETDIG